MRSTRSRTKPDVGRREVWSFFSGAMGLDLGLESVGLHATLAVEIEPAYCDTIRANRPDLKLIQGDVAKLKAADLRERTGYDGDVFLMVGGPPCQSFSSGGKRAALNDPRGNLIYEYFRLVNEVRPRYFVMENVANLTTAALQHRPIADRPGQHWSLKKYDTQGSLPLEDGADRLTPDELSGSALRQIVADARGMGYHICFGVLDAADYGAPQKRLRFVMFGARDFPPPELPAPTHGDGEGLLPYATVKDAIWKLRKKPGPHSEYTDAVARIFAMVPEGGTWRDLPESMHREALGGAYYSGGGKTGFFRRLSWSRPSPTITGRGNRKGSALCHPDQVRPLSVLECAAIQGFPADWQFEGAMSSQYMQIGNAVPVRLGEAIGRAVLAHEKVAAEQAAKAMGVWNPDFDAMMAKAVHRLRSAARNKRPAKAAA